MDIGNMMKLMGAWNRFQANHPKFPMFCKAAVSKGLREGSLIEIAVTTPEGERIETNLRVQASDLELLREFENMKQM